jgi:DNA-binding MltR family transcriptional regulator
MRTAEVPFLKIEEVFAFRSSLTGETDRGCALMAAAYLSDQLEKLLRSLFVVAQQTVDRLFEPLGPAGSFSARIDLAYACGLLPESAYNDLHLMRKIRNDFGHVAEPLTFDEPAIADRCHVLQHSVLEAKARSRAKFTNAALGVCAVIHAITYTTRHRAVPQDFVWDEEKKSQVRDAENKLAAKILERLRMSDDGRTDKTHP